MCTEGAATEPPLPPYAPIGPSQLGCTTVRLLIVIKIFIAMVNFAKREEEVLAYDGCCSRHAAATTVTAPYADDHVILDHNVNQEHVDVDVDDEACPGFKRSRVRGPCL